MLLALALFLPVLSGPSATGDLPESLTPHLTKLRTADAASVAEAMRELLLAEAPAIDALVDELCDPATRGAVLEHFATNDEAEAARIRSGLGVGRAEPAAVRTLIGPYLETHLRGAIDDTLEKRLKKVERDYKKGAGKLLAAVPNHSPAKRAKKVRQVETWRAAIGPALKTVEDENTYRVDDRGASAQKRVDASVRELWQAHQKLRTELDKDLKRMAKAKVEALAAGLEDADRWRAAHAACLEALAGRKGVKAKALGSKDDERLRLGRAMLFVASGDVGAARQVEAGGPALDPYAAYLLRYMNSQRVLDHNDTVDVGRELDPVTRFERDIVRRVNAYRLALEREPLEIQENLLEAARGHSAEMGRENYFAHDSPHAERATFAKRTKLAGYTSSTVGECIFSGTDKMTSEDVFLGWYGSSTHHRLLISPHYTQVGVGRVGHLVTANLGGDRRIARW